MLLIKQHHTIMKQRTSGRFYMNYLTLAEGNDLSNSFISLLPWKCHSFPGSNKQSNIKSFWIISWPILEVNQHIHYQNMKSLGKIQNELQYLILDERNDVSNIYLVKLQELLKGCMLPGLQSWPAESPLFIKFHLSNLCGYNFFFVYF